jgi:hypothetical protein
VRMEETRKGEVTPKKNVERRGNELV